MAGSPPGSSSYGYVPIQHPGYATYTSTSSVSWSEQPQTSPPAEYKSAFSLEEIEMAKDIVTKLSNK